MHPSQAKPYHMHNSTMIFLATNLDNSRGPGSAPFDMRDVDRNKVNSNDPKFDLNEFGLKKFH